jgi:hypothetical protein
VSPYRCYIADPSSVVAEAISWFDSRSTLADARVLAESDSQKGLVFQEVRRAVA